MRVIRYLDQSGTAVIGAVQDDSTVVPLPCTSFLDLVRMADALAFTPLEWTRRAIAQSSPINASLDRLQLLAPHPFPEIWAAGVTYKRSQEARDYESTGGTSGPESIYDRVYTAERPEIFFKSTAARLIDPGAPLYIRSDSNWQIPEPELGIVIDAGGNVLGYTAGNDMSSRDIEGANPLYLPQAKIWKGSCAVGPAIRLVEDGFDPYRLEIRLRIFRGGKKVVDESANTSQLKRRIDELIGYLMRDNVIFDGTVLLTGTCAVPPNDFTLMPGDRIEIEIEGIGILANPVAGPASTSRP